MHHGSAARRCSILAFALLAGAAQPALADDWEISCGGNPQRNGRSTETGPAAAAILWSGARPAMIAQQGVTLGNQLVISRWDNFATGGWVTAMNLTTGAEQWSVQLPLTTAGGGNNRPTGYRDGRIFATRAGNDRLEYLYALNPSNGAELWHSQDLVSESYTESIAFTDDGDIIASRWDIFGSGTNELLRIRAADGTTAWRTNRQVPSSDGLGAVVRGNRIYIWEPSPTGPKVTAFATDTGARLYSSPVVSGGLVQQLLLMVGPDGTVYAPRCQNNPATDFFVAYTDTGSALVEKWRVPMGYMPFATHAVGNDGSVYTYTADQSPIPSGATTVNITIHRRDPATGGLLNSSAPIQCNYPGHILRMAVDAAGNLYVTNGSTSLGRVYSFNPDLTQRWSDPLPNINTAGPVLGSGGILVISGPGSNVRAYRTAASCYANCDGSTTPPILNVLDFVCFQSLFAQGSSAANCDGSTTPPILNVLDFVCFQSAYAQGCP
jgi:outer membrane protein assembly factor BamB